MGHFQVVFCPCVKLSLMKMCSAYGFIFIQIKLFFIWKVSTRTCCKIEAQSTSEMANWAATKLLQTALSTATNSSHVCQDVSTHLTLEHPSRFCWTAPSPSSFWHLQLYCNVLVCMIWFIPTTLCNHICLLLLIFDGLHVCCSFDFLVCHHITGQFWFTTMQIHHKKNLAGCLEIA